MLKTKFWSGLRDERIKSALRPKMSDSTSFNELMTEARQIELEDPQKARSNQQTEFAKQLDQVLKTIRHLEERVTNQESHHSKKMRYFKKDQSGSGQPPKTSNQPSQGKKPFKGFC